MGSSLIKFSCGYLTGVMLKSGLIVFVVRRLDRCACMWTMVVASEFDLCC